MGKTGRRIWYGIAIVLCCLVVLLSAAGIAGVWLFQQRLSSAATRVLDGVINVTNDLQQATQNIDKKLASMQDITSSISNAATKLSQQVADQGLINMLLPDTQVQSLIALSTTVQDSISSLRDMLTAARTIYQAIDALPLIRLPGPNQLQIDSFRDSINALQSAVDQVKSAIVAFRAGASDQITRIGAGAVLLTGRLGDARTRLAELNNTLSIVQAKATQLKQIATRALLLISILGTLFLAFVIYTQVETIHLYTQRWKVSGIADNVAQSTDQAAALKGEANIEPAPKTEENQDTK